MDKKRILIIDDEGFIRRALADHLTECGYETTMAADGAKGLAQARAEQFHVVLVDLRMPRVDGLEVIATLRAEQPELPVVVVSGTGVLEDAVEATRRGAWDYVTKPVQDMDEVTIVVERVLEKARLIAERDRYQRELEQLNRSLKAEMACQTQDLQVQNRKLAALNCVSYAISGPLDLDTMLNRAVDASVAAIEAEGGVVHLLNPATGQLVVAATRGLPKSYLASAQATPLGQGIIGQVAQSGHPRVGHDFSDDPPLVSLEKATSLVSYLCVPLRAGEEIVSLMRGNRKHPIVGALLVFTKAERDFGVHEVELLTAIGGQIGVAVARAQYATDLEQANVQLERLLAQVQEQAQRIQQIVDTVPEGVLLLDGGGLAGWRVIMANPVGEQNLAALTDVQPGRTLTHLGDRSLRDLLVPLPHKGWHEVKGGERIFEVIARSIEREASAEAGPTTGGWVLVIREVTQEREIRQRVQQQERLAAVGQLAAGIAHDFNNIMAVVVLHAQLSTMAPSLPAKVYEWMETIVKQSRHASDLIDQILDFSRRAVLERQPLNLEPLLKEQVKLLQRTLPETIKVELLLTGGATDYIVNADLTRMQQVLMNLAVNARDAMPAGGVLHIALSRRAAAEEINCVTCGNIDGGEWVCLTVTDSGIGIPADTLPHVFEPFYTTKEMGKGTGLGLAQVYGIVKQHEGHIDVTTEMGKGTTFTVYLPALSQPEPESPAGEAVTLPRGQAQTILVVEDDPAFRKALVGGLEALSYRALEAGDGYEALAIFKLHQGEISLVLSDLVMPEMGGMELCSALERFDPTVRVVILSGYPLEKGKAELEPARVVGWLQKPIELDQLAQVVAKALEG